MKIRVDHYLTKNELVWCASYLRHHGNKLTKHTFTSLLYDQVEMFGSDSQTLCGTNWEEDFKNQLQAATAWVEKYYPDEVG